MSNRQGWREKPHPHVPQPSQNWSITGSINIKTTCLWRPINKKQGRWGLHSLYTRDWNKTQFLDDSGTNGNHYDLAKQRAKVAWYNIQAWLWRNYKYPRKSHQILKAVYIISMLSCHLELWHWKSQRDVEFCLIHPSCQHLLTVRLLCRECRPSYC